MHSGEANVPKWSEDKGALARVDLLSAFTAVSYNANNQQTLFGANTLPHDLNRNLAT